MSRSASRIGRVQRLLAEGKAPQAEADLRRDLRSAPNDADLNAALGMVLSAVGQAEQSLYFMSRALAARPDEPTLLTNTGMLLSSLGRTDEAIKLLSRAAAIDPSSPEPRLGLANAYRRRKDFSAAAAQLKLALAQRESDPALAALYAAVLTNLARATESAAFSRDWLSRHSDLQVMIAHANAMTYAAGTAPRDVFEAHTAFGLMLDRSLPRRYTDYPNGPDPNRTIRVGLLSHDLRRHAVATFLEPWVARHDTRSIHLTAYSTNAASDEVTARLKAACQSWTDAAAMPSPALAERIRADRIDILLETTGLNQGHRLDVMAMKPAPVGAACIGYLNTLGIRAIDYRLVDPHTDPPGAELFSVEELVRLEPTCWCYNPPAHAPEPRAADRGFAVGGAPTFGSFNSAAKLNDRVIALWSSILKEIPGSRLLLKAFDFADEPLRADLAARFAREGADPALVQIEGPTLGPEFLANYHRIDIALDPFPFNGTTTTLDALWMGVPVIAFEGAMHAGRTGVSILRTLGLPDLLAQDHDAYLSIAADLARDPTRLATLRATLRPRLAASPLCDAAAYASRVDAALHAMWTRWCAARGNPPAPR